MNTIAFAAPFVLVIACALLLVREDHRERRLHRSMARDLARPRVGIDATHFTPRTLNGESGPPARPSVERPFDQQEPRR